MKIFCLVATLGAISAQSFAQAKPSLANVNAAHGRVTAIKRHLDRVIGGGGGGGGGEVSCQEIRSARVCEAKGCSWRGFGEVGRCVPRHQPGLFGGELENDVAAQLASIGLSLGMQKLANDIFQMTVYYYTPQFWQYWHSACHRSKDLLIANQGAKIAAALPQVGNFLPSYFEMYDQELIATRQLLWCN